MGAHRAALAASASGVPPLLQGTLNNPMDLLSSSRRMAEYTKTCSSFILPVTARRYTFMRVTQCVPLPRRSTRGVCMYTCMCMCMCICVCMCVYIYIYTYTCICIYVSLCFSLLSLSLSLSLSLYIDIYIYI